MDLYGFFEAIEILANKSNKGGSLSENLASLLDIAIEFFENEVNK